MIDNSARNYEKETNGIFGINVKVPTSTDSTKVIRLVNTCRTDNNVYRREFRDKWTLDII